MNTAPPRNPSARTNATCPTAKTSEPGAIQTIFRVGGPALAAVGLVLTVWGFRSFLSSLGTLEPAQHFWLAFVGIPLLGIGVTMWREACGRGSVTATPT